MKEIEIHPLQPFLPPHAQLLMLGSFPPQKKRWCMDFYYPNFINDMWRIMGIIFFNDKQYFITPTGNSFQRELIIQFLLDKKIALFDTATEIRRLQDNASDKFLEIVKPTNLKEMLNLLPECKAVVTTGQKATDTLLTQLPATEPKVGQSSDFNVEGRSMKFYRMPSSSRAYPLKLEQKAETYSHMFKELGML